MCGIVAYTGYRPALPILLSGLKRLEYRGYDSAGIAVSSPDGISIRKAKGKVSELVNFIGEASPLENSTTVIAHTRWATHGPPTRENAHPHAGGGNRIALVHNGIIENHRALREKLTTAGYTFLSETDTEVLAHLVDSLYQGDLTQAVTVALKEVEGTFGISAMAHEEPSRLVVARRGSPIVLGLGEKETIVASDASAIIAHTRQAIYLDDNDIATIKGSDLDQSSAFFIGRGYLYPVALEGALKLKEISYIHAEGYHAAELKHGPIALLEKSVPVIALCNEGPGKDKTLGNIAECQARNSRVLGIVTEGDHEAIATVDDHIAVPQCPLHTAVIPSTVALQLLSYHIARLKGCAIDQPRNLAKSVTVE